MIKFFRKIRQNLLSEGNIGKYLKYAIGEIVLVVIGILIALQLNNLNESQKERVYEVKMLSEIKLALENDIHYYHRMVNRMKKLDSSTTHFISLAYNKSTFQDSLYSKADNEGRWYMLRTGVAYRFNSGPYQAVKSSGIDKISNDSLRNLLVNFYDFELPRHMEITKWYDRDYEKHNMILDSFLEPAEIIEKESGLEIAKKFPSDLFKRQEFIELIGELRKRARFVGNYIESIIPEMENIIGEIEIEISK
jgi:hypothetical protein